MVRRGTAVGRRRRELRILPHQVARRVATDRAAVGVADEVVARGGERSFALGARGCRVGGEDRVGDGHRAVGLRDPARLPRRRVEDHGRVVQGHRPARGDAAAGHGRAVRTDGGVHESERAAVGDAPARRHGGVHLDGAAAKGEAPGVQDPPALPARRVQLDESVGDGGDPAEFVRQPPTVSRERAAADGAVPDDRAPAHGELAGIGDAAAVAPPCVVEHLARRDPDRSLVPDAAARVVGLVVADAAPVECEDAPRSVEDAAAQIGRAREHGAVGEGEVAEVQDRAATLADGRDEAVLDRHTGDRDGDTGADEEDAIEPVAVDDRPTRGTADQVEVVADVEVARGLVEGSRRRDRERVGEVREHHRIAPGERVRLLDGGAERACARPRGAGAVARGGVDRVGRRVDDEGGRARGRGAGEHAEKERDGKAAGAHAELRPTAEPPQGRA